MFIGVDAKERSVVRHHNKTHLIFSVSFVDNSVIIK